jgi:hypothetical protein
LETGCLFLFVLDYHAESCKIYIIGEFMRKAHNRKDLSGQTINSWQVLEVDTSITGKVLHYKARCLECGDIYSVRGVNIRHGTSKRCVKCGCGHGHSKQKGQIRTKRTPLESALYYTFLKLRRDSRKRKLEWSLTEEQVYDLILKKCAYCNLEPKLITTPLKHQGLSQRRTSEATLVRNGIDRVDSSKGYVVGNVVPCCSPCNSAKMDMSLDDFKAWARVLATHLLGI